MGTPTRKTIKHYSAALYEESMTQLKTIIGKDTTTQQAIAEAVQFTIENRISEAELEEMAKNEKTARGGKNGKQNI